MTSKIKVDNINKVSDDSNIIKKCGSTTTVGSGSGQTIVVDGATVTLGRCGGAVNLASGATQTGFGRTGTVDWQTGSIKTATFTAANGEGYFANTTGGAFNMNLPAGVAGAIVSVADYAETFQTNNLTIVPNGSDKIGSLNQNATLSTQGQSATFVFVDSTQGWINTMDSTSNVRGKIPFVVATGGTITESGDYRIHTFTSSGCFAVTNLAQCSANDKASYLVVAGGGSGGDNIAGGGGGGGFREGKLSTDPYTASPLAATPCSSITLAVQTYPITVGAGGTTTGPFPSQTNGSNSIFTTITSAGGGRGGRFPCSAGTPGGSGGGSVHGAPTGGTGNTPPVSPPQGNPGGPAASPSFPQLGAGGGGGAGGSGQSGTNPRGGDGGIGAGTQINPAAGTPGPSGTLRYFAGGAGGGIYSLSQPNPTYASGGAGGGAPSWGTGNPIPSPNFPRKGTANTGGGGAQYSAGAPCTGGTGGSGVVIIRYKFQ